MVSKTTMLSWGRIEERETSIESLPDELLFHILVRLPADFLHDRARLVCTKWWHVIRSNSFINTHLQQYSSYGLLFSSLSESHSHPHSIYVTATQGGRIEASDLSYRRRRNEVIASGNGLTLQLHHDPNNAKALSLHVINPATKQSFRLPSVSTHNGHVYYGKCGIAYSAASMEYKVTLPYNVNGQFPNLDIVTVGVDKSWRCVEFPPLPEDFRLFFDSLPLSSEGFLHWGRWRYCLTLNVETEIITMTEVCPPGQSVPYSWYGYLSTGRYLTRFVALGKFSWEVWEMKPSESGDQWRNVLPDIDLEPQQCMLQQQFAFDEDYKHVLFPVLWVKYPEILAFRFLCAGNTCIFYNLETHEINTIDLPRCPSCYTAVMHRNSLVWLSQDV